MLQMKTNTIEILDLIEKNLGESCFWRKYRKQLPLIYSENFSLFECLSQYNNFVLIIPTKEDVPLELFRGVHKYIKENNYLFIHNSRLIREMENNMIPFFDNNGAFHANKQSNVNKELTYTKTTQLVVKYLLLVNDKDVSTRRVAAFLGISNTSVKRAYDFLESVGAIQKEGSYTSTVTYGIKSKKHLLETVKKYFIIPYKRTARILVDYGDLDRLNNKTYYGAEHVLPLVSDLDNPDDIELAMDSNTFNEMLGSDYSYGDELITIEEWIYKVDYFIIDKSIDSIDAYIVLSKRYKNTTDSRISSAIKQLERAIINNESQ